MDAFQDAGHTVRALFRDFGFTATVVSTLAIGVGANTAVFGVVRSVLLRPLPYPAPEELVMIWSQIAEQGVTESPSAYGNVQDWDARARSLDELATFDPVSLTLSGGEWPEQVQAARASANLFPVLGVEPALGRAFTRDDVRLQAPLAVLSHGFWQRRFDGSTNVIGRIVEIAGTPLEVIGVMPEGFGFPGKDTELWVPQSLFGDWGAEAARRGTDTWRVVGRLAAGASIEQAARELEDVARQLERSYPAENAGVGVKVVSLHRQVTGDSFRLGLWMLFGAVGLLLLIACANVAHLYVARGMDRAQGFAVRVALGATAPRLIRHALTESLALSLLAAFASLVVAAGALRAFALVAPGDVPPLDEVGLDAFPLIYGTALALAAGVLCGIVPAVRYARSAPYHVLREGRSPTPARNGARSAMIAAQFALAIVLVFGSNLLIRSLIEARRVDPGFDPANVLIANLSVSAPEQRVAFYEQVLESARTIQQVRSAGLIEEVFISGAPNRQITVEGRLKPTLEAVELRIEAIAGDLFGALGVPLRAGRAFSDGDGADAVPVAIVNETVARRFWPGESPLGKRFRMGASAEAPWIEVVGVVGDMRRQGPENAPISQVFRPYVQATSRNMVLVVRADGPLAELASAVRSGVASIDPNIPLYQVAPLEGAMERYFVQRRFQTLTLSAFSLLALSLAAVGIYGLVRHSVAQRTREIGLRLALGAASRQVLFMILRQGLWIAAPGLLAGILGALWLAEALSTLLYGVAASDFTTVIVTTGVLLLTTVLACYAPARRAARVDPTTAMHGS